LEHLISEKCQINVGTLSGLRVRTIVNSIVGTGTAGLEDVPDAAGGCAALPFSPTLPARSGRPIDEWRFPMRRIVIAAAVITVLGSPAFAQFTQARWDKLLKKYTAEDLHAKPKVLCVCFDGSQDFVLGTVVRGIFNSTDGARCIIPIFGGDGLLAFATPCNGPFTALAR
jgi:hypothetical protein